MELAISVIDAIKREETAARSARRRRGPARMSICSAAAMSGPRWRAPCALLPLHVVVVETRADALDDMPLGVENRLNVHAARRSRAPPLPAPPFIVLTHDHALDFLIVAEALGRADAAYVGIDRIEDQARDASAAGIVGEAGGTEEAFARVVCPIGRRGCEGQASGRPLRLWWRRR